MKSSETLRIAGAGPSPADISLQLDGQPRRVSAGTTLADLVAALDYEPQAVSTAVNGEFVAREARTRVLAEGDQVLVFQPIVGG